MARIEPQSELSPMRNLIRKLVIVSMVACGAGLLSGCSVIGYFAGGAIDGPMNDVDSVTATPVSEGAAVNPNPRFRYDAKSLTSLLKEVSTEDEDFIAHAVASSVPDSLILSTRSRSKS
jgi:hypothetical protein